MLLIGAIAIAVGKYLPMVVGRAAAQLKRGRALIAPI